MCFERTDEKVKPFHIGYKVMKKGQHGYKSCLWDQAWAHWATPNIKLGQWIDERPYREYDAGNDLLFDDKFCFPGWHIFSTIAQPKSFMREFENSTGGSFIVRVECYGLAKPYGLGVAYGEPAGRFQFMKILEEVK